MFSKELVKEAHKMAKEIRKEYPEVNYSFQFGLNIKYLLSKVEGVEKEMKIFLSDLKEIGPMGKVLETENIETSKGTYKLPTLVEDNDGFKFEIEYKVWEKYGKCRLYMSGDVMGYIEILADGKSKVSESGKSRAKGVERGINYFFNGEYVA